MVTPELNGRPGVRPLTAPPGSGGPTVLRILLGAQLRQLREARRISLEDAGQVNPRLAVEDEPSGDRPGRFQGPRHHRSAGPVRGYRPGCRREALRAWPSGPAPRAGGTTTPTSSPGWFEAYVGLEEAASRHPGLRAPVRAGPAPDAGVRPGRHPPRARRRGRRRDRPPGQPADGPPGAAGQPAGPAPVGGARRGGAAPPGRPPGRHARPAQAPAGLRAAAGDHPAGPAVQGGRARRGRRAVQHPPVRRVRPARHRVPGAADQRAVPGQAG